jgi:hypothetical protein
MVTVAADSTWPAPVATLPCPPGWVFFPDTAAAPLPLYLSNCGATYWFDYLPDHHVVYFQFNSVADDPAEPLEAFCGRLFDLIDANPVDKLVIDLRWNRGGDTFLVLPLLHRLIGCGKVNQRGRLFVIIGRNTFSAAQNTATFIERHTNAVNVGEPTGSRPNFVGETTTFQLPYSKLVVNVSDLYWQSSWPMDHRAWIAPELYTPPPSRPTAPTAIRRWRPSWPATSTCQAGNPASRLPSTATVTITVRVVFDAPKGKKLDKVELHDSAFSGGVEAAL